VHNYDRTGTGMRKVGRADIDTIHEPTRSYREIDNRLGRGKLRTMTTGRWSVFKFR
jgi:hypothetical protein